METAMKIRRMVLVDQRSIRSVSKETGISRNTVRKYVRDDSAPSYDRSQPAPRHKLKNFEAQLTEWHEFDLKRPTRERRTAQRLYEQIVLTGYDGSYSPVCRFIQALKRDSSVSQQAFIPLLFEAGDAVQFDWSQEVVMLGGIEQKIKVAHFKLAHSRKQFVIAYPRETQEMLLDSFAQALKFYDGVPKRVLIDNPKTMVVRIGKGKERDFHPRFMALMNHYAVEPVACTPASGWEKGRIENQVKVIRNWLFKPQLSFDDMAALNVHLLNRCESLGSKLHPDQKDKTIDAVFSEERPQLRSLGRAFDGYVERTVKVTSTCLVQYDSNHYSVPSSYAKKPISLRAYANRVVMVADQKVIAEHSRSFGRHVYVFEPWHYVPLLARKPGALRNGAPFAGWALPASMDTIKALYLKRSGGDRDFVSLLQMVEQYGFETLAVACEVAIENKTTQLSAIINLLHRLTEEEVEPIKEPLNYPSITVPPEANCARYEQLRTQEACS